MPHGEHLVLVLRDQVSVRAIMTDIGEEVAVMGDRPLPEAVERIRIDVEPGVKALALHIDVFTACCGTSRRSCTPTGSSTRTPSWAEVARCLREHADDHPGLDDAVAAYDLMGPEFRHSCLNRLQMRNTLEMVDLADQAESLIYAGTRANPVASR